MFIGLVLMAIAIPVASKLVQQNQENRGQAADKITPIKVYTAGNTGEMCTNESGITCQIYRDTAGHKICNQNCNAGFDKITPTKGSSSVKTVNVVTVLPTTKVENTSSTCNRALDITYGCGSNSCAYYQKSQQWTKSDCKTEIICVDDSSCKNAITPTVASKVCDQFKLDSNNVCQEHRYFVETSTDCNASFPSNCDINKKVVTATPTLKKITVTPTTIKAAPTPRCKMGIDYNGDHTVNSLDILVCYTYF